MTNFLIASKLLKILIDAKAQKYKTVNFIKNCVFNMFLKTLTLLTV